jgi:hypothetical protein
MNRRCNDALYITEELLEKIEERGRITLWDGVNMIYPRTTNRKHFDVALKFLNHLSKCDQMSNRDIMEIFDTQNEKLLLVGKILPKLKKFKLIESDSKDGAKLYNLRYTGELGKLLKAIGSEINRDLMLK